MSALFLKRFLLRPMQVASIIPSSKKLIRKVSEKMDLTAPRVVAEFGPGEGCHTREILRRMHPEASLLLFELDPELAEHLQEQFCGDSRVTVLNTNALELSDVLARRGLSHCDYIVSGIPFSILEKGQKRDLLRKTYDALAPSPLSAFIIYQVTNELREKGHCAHFARAESEYCLQNLPPMYVTKFYKMANGTGNGSSNGHHANGANGHERNGNGLH